VVALGKLFADPVWYFYLFWGAKFLNAQFGVELKGLALPLIIIYIVAWSGGMAGGAISSALLKKGKSANFARKITMLGTALAGAACDAGSVYRFVARVCWIDCIWPLLRTIHGRPIFLPWLPTCFQKRLSVQSSDFLPQSVLLGGMITALLIGYALNESGTDGYVFPFVIAAFGYLAGLLVIHLISPKMKPVSGLID
jgi:MFS transporter, ACS family, hexuronate transporter